MKTLLILRYFIWSMLIFAVSMLLLSVRGLRPWELQIVALQSYRQYRTNEDFVKGAEVPFLSIPIYDAVSTELYLQIARDVVHHLKSAGAKVVIVPLPQIFRPTESMVKCIQAIDADSIAVFGAFDISHELGRAFPEPPLDDRHHWWMQHTTFPHTSIPWGAITERSRAFTLLTRIVPIGFKDFHTGASMPDVAVVALKRFFNIPDNSELPASPTRIQIGPHAFQVAHDGLSYIRAQTFIANMTRINLGLESMSDSVSYYTGSWTKPYSATILQAAWEAHRGKIVFLDWSGATGFRFPSYAWIYMQVFGAYFTGSFIAVHNEWNVLLITTLVILLSILSYTVRNGLMVLVSFLMIVGSVVLSLWLFNSHSILFDPVYIIVPIFLCGAILPIVKVAGEKRLAEEKIKSLEEENKRLLDLQRSAQADPHP